MMFKKNLLTLILPLLILFSSCQEKDANYLIEVSNKLDMPRQNETVEISKASFNNMLCQEFERLVVTDQKTGTSLPSQVLDTDMDGELDILVFQPVLEAGETRKYNLIPQQEPVDYTDMDVRTFSRFVPERTDDYAWENDRVAFRTYGPTAEKMIVDGTPGGTLSSGMDCWLKRVDYPIIDKWYRQALEEDLSYHKDHGEGLDDFHVGLSRGCGGIGIWSQDEEKLYTSRNFSSWNTLAEGPLRTLFELEYQPWDGPAGKIKEKKTISLDLGSNLMKVELSISSQEQLESVSSGITLHEKDGTMHSDKEAGCFSYWQPHADSEMGMGIIVPSQYLTGYTEHVSEQKEQSHLIVHMKPVNGKVIYFTGFGWKKSGLFTTENEWINYLEEFSKTISSPLEVSYLF
jgi:hypothetical protein